MTFHNPRYLGCVLVPESHPLFGELAGPGGKLGPHQDVDAACIWDRLEETGLIVPGVPFVL